MPHHDRRLPCGEGETHGGVPDSVRADVEPGSADGAGGRYRGVAGVSWEFREPDGEGNVAAESSTRGRRVADGFGNLSTERDPAYHTGRASRLYRCGVDSRQERTVQ